MNGIFKRTSSAILIAVTVIAYFTVSVSAAAPTVYTSWYEDLTRTTVTWVGELVLNGGENVTDVGFMYGTTSSNMSTKKSYGYMGSAKGSYRVYVTGLSVRTTYYFRAYAVNKDGTSYGTIFSILTPDVPSITTMSATNITTNSATLTGNLTANNGESVYDCGFLYGVGSSLTQSISYGNIGNNKGSISKTVIGLQPNTTYSYRAYAANKIGQVQGTIYSFTTQKAQLAMPVVSGVSSGGTKDKGNITISWGKVANATSYTVALRDLTTNTVKINNASITSTSYTLASSNFDYNHRYRLAVGAFANGYLDAWREVEFTINPDKITVTGLSSQFEVYQGQTINLNGILSSNTNITKVTINVLNESDVIVSETMNVASVNLNKYQINTAQGVFANRVGTYTIRIWATSVGKPDGGTVPIATTTLVVRKPVLVAPYITNLQDGREIAKANYTVTWNPVAIATGYLVALRDLDTDTLIFSNVSTTTTSYTIQGTSLQYAHNYRFAVAATYPGVTPEWSEAVFKVAQDVPILSGLKSSYTVLQGQSFNLEGIVSANTSITKVTINILNWTDNFMSVTPNTTSYSLSNLTFNTNSGILAGRNGMFTVNVWATAAGCPNAMKIGAFTLNVKNVQLDAPSFTNITDGATINKADYTVVWSSVADATAYRLVLRNQDTGVTVFNQNVTGTSYKILASQLERGTSYSLTVTATASGRAENSRIILFRTNIGSIVASAGVTKVAPNVFEFTLNSDYRAPKAVVQFKLSDGSWMSVADVANDSRFILTYQQQNSNGDYVYTGRFSVSQAGNRTLRFLLLDNNNNVLYTSSRDYNISVDSLIEIAKSSEDDRYIRLRVNYADSSISSVKWRRNGTEVLHASRRNGVFEDYVIDKSTYADGTYTFEVWGCEYATDKVLSVSNTVTFNISNPLVIFDIQPVTLKRGESRIHISGTNLKDASFELFIDGQPASSVFGSGSNSLKIIQQNSYTDVIADIPSTFDKADQTYKIDVKATLAGKEWTHPFWIEKRTVDEESSEGAEAAYKRALQMHDFEWTPLKPVRGWRQRRTYAANVKHVGIPYGQPTNSGGGYVGFSYSFAQVRTALADEDSNFYKNYAGYNNSISPAYSLDCSALVSYAWGRGRITTVTFDDLATQGTYTHIGTDASTVQAGDILNNRASHVVLVYRVVKNADGSIKSIHTIEECASYDMQKFSYTIATLQNRIDGNDWDKLKYKIIRNPNLSKVTYTEDSNAPINYDAPPTVTVASFGITSSEIEATEDNNANMSALSEFEPIEEDVSQQMQVTGNITSTDINRANNSINLTFDRPVIQLFEERLDRIAIIKNGNMNVRIQETDYVTFEEETLSIFLSDTAFFDDCSSLKVNFDIAIVAFPDGYNTETIETLEESTDEASDSDFDYQGTSIDKSGAVSLLFNRPLQNANITSSIKLLDSANRDITTQYAFSAMIEGSMIKVSFVAMPLETFKIQIAPNVIKSIAGDTISGILLTDSLTIDPTLIQDSGFIDDSVDLTKTLHPLQLRSLQFDIWESRTLRTVLTVKNGTDTDSGEFDAIVAMYDTNAGTLIGLGKSTTKNKLKTGETADLYIDISLTENRDGKYDNGGYHFKVLLWDEMSSMMPIADNVPQILYLEGI